MTHDEFETEIDFDHLNQYVSGDADLTAEVFGLFKNQVDMLEKSLRPDSDDEVWAAITHSLKGTAKAVGAVQLADICEKAEALVGTNNRPGARDLAAANIESRISLVMVDIQRWEYRQTMARMRST
ncbi:MAG: Hpt domain-containing protein [Alphaproteobacteria bacterium]